MKRCIVPPIKMATQILPAHPWPFSPILELPGGDLRNHHCGRVLTAQQFVLAVGLSPQHFIAVAQAPGVGKVQSVLDQAIGFLVGRGAGVVLTNLRAPIHWFINSAGQFEWRKCLVYFTRSFLGTDPTDPPWLPPHIWPTVPLGIIAGAGQRHWRKVEQILEGVEAADLNLLPTLGSSLTSMGKRWELYLARMIVLSQRAEVYDVYDRVAVEQCDRLFHSLMTRFEPGYEFMPFTIARLL